MDDVSERSDRGNTSPPKSNARRLTTIVAVDAAGFSASMESDESTTIKKIQVMHAAIAAVVEVHGGRVFHRAGDGLLAEFSSPVNAVRASLEGRRAVLKAAREGEALPIRIGVHMGDVEIQSDGDLLGHAVNVASRLEGAGAPGDILVSDAVWALARSAVRASANGPVTVKLSKMSESCTAWRLMEREHVDSGRKDSRIKGDGPAAWLIAALIACLVAAIALISTNVTESRSPQSAGTEPGREVVSLAVMPFVALSSNPDDDFFAIGLSQEISQSLARVDKIDVIARASAVAAGQEPRALTEIGALLGVRYLLEGTVRRSGARFRIAAALVRASDGVQIWADTFDYDIRTGDVIAVQTDIAEHVADVLGVAIDDTARARMRRFALDDVDAFIAFERAMQLLWRGDRADLAEADALLALIVARAPDFALAHHFRSFLIYSDAIHPEWEVLDASNAEKLRAVERFTAAAANMRAIRTSEPSSRPIAWRSPAVGDICARPSKRRLRAIRASSASRRKSASPSAPPRRSPTCFAAKSHATRSIPISATTPRSRSFTPGARTRRPTFSTP